MHTSKSLPVSNTYCCFKPVINKQLISRWMIIGTLFGATSLTLWNIGSCMWAFKADSASCKKVEYMQKFD